MLVFQILIRLGTDDRLLSVLRVPAAMIESAAREHVADIGAHLADAQESYDATASK